MREIGLKPDLVLCSPSVRTRETARLALAALGEPQLPINFADAIYEARPGDLLHLLQNVENHIGHVLIIGHNPGLEQLIFLLTGGRLEGVATEMLEKLPTGALVVLNLNIDLWSGIGKECGTVTHYATPRSLVTD